MLKIQHTLCPRCNKMVPRAVGICILCGEVTEQVTAQPELQPDTQPKLNWKALSNLYTRSKLSLVA